MSKENIIFADKTEYENLLKKYPTSKKEIQSWVEYTCNRYSKMTPEQKEVFGFEQGMKREFCEKVKESLLFVDSSFEGLAYNKVRENLEKEFNKKDEIDWESTQEEIHPRLAYHKGKIYIGVYLPVKNEGKVRKKLFIISSDGEKFNAEKEEELPFFLKFELRYFHPRWSRNSIKKFLEKSVEKISIKDSFFQIKEIWKEYMELPDKYYTYLSLWTILTYFQEFVNTFPELFLSAIKRAGKTKALTILSLLCWDGVLIQDPSGSTMFRLSNTRKSTILIDEIKKQHYKAEENIAQMIRGKYKRGIVIPRAEEGKKKGSFDIVEHELFGPLGMANIKGVEDDIEDRNVRLVFRRAKDERKANKEPEPLDEVWSKTRDNLHLCLMFDHKLFIQRKEEINLIIKGLGEAGRDFITRNFINNKPNKEIIDKIPLLENSLYHPLLSTNLMSRELELWKPILIMASCVSNEVFKNMCDFSQEISRIKSEDDIVSSPDLLFIRALIELTYKKERVRGEVDRGYSTTNILEELEKYYSKNVENLPNSQNIGNTLKRLDICKEKKLIHGRTKYILHFEDVKEYAETIPMDVEEIIEEIKQENPKVIKI